LDAWQQRLPKRAIGLAGLALLFFANMVFLATSRTTVMVFICFVVIFMLQRFDWKRAILGIMAACILAALTVALSPYLRERIVRAANEVHAYQQSGVTTSPLSGIASAGIRLEFWKQSLRIMAEAPVIGSGTGSVEAMFRKNSAGQSGSGTLVTANPHNQTFAIGIQLGLVGVIVLYGMWIAQALLFCRIGLAAWLGLAVVVQNCVSSLVNSYIFDFGSGWMFVFGVGVLGGTVLRTGARTEMTSAPRRNPIL
jgi:O-antigen ligase